MEEPVIIAGAGIGGLTAAIALSQQGVDCLVLERSDSIRAEGAGITLQTNAMLVMQRLGLADRLRHGGVPILEGRILDRAGGTIQRMDLRGVAAELGVSGIALHRARLLETLAEANAAPVELAVGVDSFEMDEERVRVELDDGGRRDASVLIGCDGLHSAVRRALRGKDPLVYAGYTTWRGVACGAAPVQGSTEIWGAGDRFGIVPIGPDEIYWFAVAEASPGGTDDGDVIEGLSRRFDGWPAGVHDVLSHTASDAVIRTDTYDRDPIDGWGRGRVTLLGDAAHPMTPNLGQGAGQAVEDALALALAVARHANARVDGLRAYESARRERANRFVTLSRRMGHAAQLRNPLARRLRDLVMRLTPDRSLRRSILSMYTPVVG